jgi:hypothetical protein
MRVPVPVSTVAFWIKTGTEAMAWYVLAYGAGLAGVDSGFFLACAGNTHNAAQMAAVIVSLFIFTQFVPGE